MLCCCSLGLGYVILGLVHYSFGCYSPILIGQGPLGLVFCLINALSIYNIGCWDSFYSAAPCQLGSVVGPPLPFSKLVLTFPLYISFSGEYNTFFPDAKLSVTYS